MTATRIFGHKDPARAYRVREAAYAVVLDERGHLACVAEDSGLFLPGGGLEVGEDALDAVHREVAEECARTIEIIARLEPAVQYFVTQQGVPHELRASFFLARFGAELEREAQHQLFWLPVEPMPELYHECHRWAVEQGTRKRAEGREANGSPRR
jgi:8-oxo-dGTP diphosphatase